MTKHLFRSVLVLIGCCASLAAQERLIDEEPFDEITLDAANNNVVLRTLPLELPNRQVPKNPEPTSRLRLRLVDRPKRLYDCEWQHIVKVRLFEEMVLAEAEKLTAAEDFAEAFEYYDYLLKNYPNWPALPASVDAYLYKHALAEMKAGRPEESLALLTELAERNPSARNLERAFDSVAARVITDRVKQERFDAARGAIALVHEKFPKSPLTKVEQLRSQMIAQAVSLRDAARKHVSAGKLREAQLASQRALAIWPEAEGVRDLAREIDHKYPVVTVGVLEPASSATGRVIDDWASRRIGRALMRQWVELAGFSSEGGVYRSPVGGLGRDDSGTRWSIRLRPEIVTDHGDALTGYELARQLLAAADDVSTPARKAWHDAFRGVAVEQVFGVQIDLDRSLVRPERLLQAAQFNPVPWPTPQSAESSSEGEKQQAYPEYLRPYRLNEPGDEARLYANRAYFAYDSGQPQELVERRFVDPEEAVTALRRSEIDVLDRVPPWEVGALASNDAIGVERYLLPTVHVLVPNHKRKLAGNRALRRAVLYGTNRQQILERVLLAGRSQEGSKVVSGPFVSGTSTADATGYGSDNTIEPAPYEPRLAIALFEIAMKELFPDEKKDEAEDPREAASAQPEVKLVLAYAAEPVARLACSAIAEHLKRVRIDVELREFDAAKAGPGDDYDFLYAELAAWEPVVDAPHVLGNEGLAGTCSNYMSLALAKLEQAVTWKDIRRRLAEVHRLASDELVVVPLWQTVNHYAYRRGAIEPGKQIVTLYQNVEQWKKTQPVAAR